MGHRERERGRAANTLLKLQASRESPPPAPPLLFIAAERNKLRLRGKPPLPHSPVWHMQHAPCATYVQSMRQQLKRKTKKENAMGQLATCHLPHTLGQALHSCCTVVCLAIESALSYLPRGARGHGGVAGLIDGPHLPHGSAQAGSSSLPHNEVGTMPQIEAGSYPLSPFPLSLARVARQNH